MRVAYSPCIISTTGGGFQIEYPAITLHTVSRVESGPSCRSFGQVIGEEDDLDDAFLDINSTTTFKTFTGDENDEELSEVGMVRSDSQPPTAK